VMVHPFFIGDCIKHYKFQYIKRTCPLVSNSGHKSIIFYVSML
jgi:hypothetical protein